MKLSEQIGLIDDYLPEIKQLEADSHLLKDLLKVLAEADEEDMIKLRSYILLSPADIRTCVERAVERLMEEQK